MPDKSMVLKRYGFNLHGKCATALSADNDFVFLKTQSIKYNYDFISFVASV